MKKVEISNTLFPNEEREMRTVADLKALTDKLYMYYDSKDKKKIHRLIDAKAGRQPDYFRFASRILLMPAAYGFESIYEYASRLYGDKGSAAGRLNRDPFDPRRLLGLGVYMADILLQQYRVKSEAIRSGLVRIPHNSDSRYSQVYLRVREFLHGYSKPGRGVVPEVIATRSRKWVDGALVEDPDSLLSYNVYDQRGWKTSVAIMEDPHFLRALTSLYVHPNINHPQDVADMNWELYNELKPFLSDIFEPRGIDVGAVFDHEEW